MHTGPAPLVSTRVMARVLLAAAATIVAIGTMATPAAADGAIPTNFESVIDDIRPATDGVAIEVVGGDAFLQVRADRGVEVDIPGYDGEPYLRIDRDGVVSRNERSAATFLNSSRGGPGGDRLPDSVDPGAEPDWRVVGTDGVIAWHDHRIHWMFGDTPAFDEGETVQVWMVPMQVDGTDVEVSGRLLYRSDQLPWPGAVVVTVALGAWFASRRAPLRAALGVIAASTAFAISLVEYLSQPSGAEPSAVPLAVAAAAVLSSIAAATVRSAVLRRAAPLATVALLAGWFVGSATTMWMPILPGPIPDAALRSLTAAVLGVALGIAVAILVAPDLERAAPGRPTEVVQDSKRRSSGSQS